MFYASFGILAIIHHLIINIDVLKNGKKLPSDTPSFRYRQFLNSILIFYTADVLWGFLEENRLRYFVYADTVLFFAAMALSVHLWTRYVVAFLGKKRRRATAFFSAGWGIFGFVIILLVINFFYPVIFYFKDGTEYIPLPGRYLILIVQLVLFSLITVYSFFVSAISTGRDKVHYRAICLSGGIMSTFIAVQMFDAFVPYYTIGCFIANSLIHVFVEEDEKLEQGRISEENRKGKERYTQIATSLAKDYDAIYYINIESGNYFEVSASEAYETMNVQKFGKDFYEDTRENARKYAHPDDRAFAVSMYYKETMLRNLNGRNSYAYRYRVMMGDEARYFRFLVFLSDDKNHFILCDKDINDTITADTALLEEQKAQVTFAQIAESLASNYDVIYYVDIESGQYVGYTTHDIYGELEVDQSGDDFFADARKNISKIIHPQDRERILSSIDRDYLISTLENRRQYVTQYRLIIDDRSQNTRLTARKSSGGGHLIIGVENIDAEVSREKEHLHALNTEKELARRDELTGTKNKTAYAELEKSIQDAINNNDREHISFAIAVCDLNNLKMINDSMGHKAGDDYIISSAGLLCETFDHSPVFRVGGDEFVIFLSGRDYDARNELIFNLHNRILANINRHEGPVIAIGMSEFIPGRDTCLSDVFNRADRFMYEDKHALKLRS